MFTELIELLLLQIVEFRRRKLLGTVAATLIQSTYRGYRLRYTHRKKLMQLKVPIRVERAIVIQCAMRRFLGTKEVKQRRVAYQAAALFIQRCFRGYVVRRWLRRQWAARVLQKAAKTFKDRQFFNTVMMLVQLRKLFQRRDVAVVKMQKIVRGHITRMQIRRHRWNILMKFHEAARIMQTAFKVLKRFKERQRRLAAKRDRTKFMRKLAQLIEELYFQRADRRALMSLMQNAAPAIQCLVRGYIGRTRATRMVFLREALRSWCNPVFAADFMRQHLERRIAYLGGGSDSVIIDGSALDLKTAGATRKGRQPVTYLMEFIPTHLQKGFIEVDKTTLFTALTKWYKKIAKPLLITEIESIYQRFRNPVDGKVTIPVLDAYISKHKMPCRKHARVVCGDCVYFRECNVGSCQCKCFKRDAISGKSCRQCHHSIVLHTIYPLDLKPSRRKMGKTMLDILNSVTEPDLSLPTVVSGIELNDIGKEIYRKKWSVEKSFKSAKLLEMSGSSVLDTTEPLSESQRLVKSLTMLDVSGAVMANTKEYWAQTHPHLPINKGPDMIQIHACDVVPGTDLDQAQFWKAAPKNPNKSVRDYHEKFEHSMPLPIVADGEVMFTLEGAATYVQLLQRIIQINEKDPRRGIHHDNGDFLRLVVDHIQLFERHWRKMVVDIRQGELNRHAHVSEKARILYCSTAMPRPAVATKLDTAFRNLGFHMKVLGKDIIMKGYASRKKPSQGVFRRPSFPENTLGSSGFRTGESMESRESLGSAVSASDGGKHVSFSAASTAGNVKDERAIMSASLDSGVQAKRTLKHFISTPISLGGVQTLDEFGFTGMSSQAPSAGGTEQSLSGSPTRVHSTSRSGTKKKKFNKMEAMVMANTVGTAAAKELKDKQMAREARGATANRRNLVRRGSDTDTVRPSTVEELRKIEHSLATEPRIDYHTLIAVGGRFICPFPACGMSFTSRDAAFQHLKTHEQRNRLYAPSPLADSHMNFYWPRDNSWRDDPKYTRRAIPPGAIQCSVKGCQDVFLSYHRLEYHMKLVHNQESRSSIMQSFFKFIGKNTPTPPYPPPPYAPAVFCSSHLKLEKKCPHCSGILTLDVPHQPMNFYDSVRVDFNKRDGRGGDILVERAGGDKGLFCKVKDNASGAVRVMKGRPVGLVKDCHHDGWVAVQEVVTIVEAQEKKRRVPRDGDVHHEVVILHESDGSGTVSDPGAPVWIRLVEVTGYFYLVETTKEDFRFRVRNGEIPKENVYFIRPIRPSRGTCMGAVSSRPVTPDTGNNDLTLPPI